MFLLHPLLFGFFCLICIPAWRHTQLSRKFIWFDVLSLFGSFVTLICLVVLGFYKDDDGAPTAVAFMFFPILWAIFIYMRVFLFERWLGLSPKITLIVSFLLISVVTPTAYAFMIGDSYFNKCEHCEGQQCVDIGCGG